MSEEEGTWELPEGAGAVPDQVQADLDARQKEINRKLLDKVASDPSFKDKLLDNPQEAMKEAGVEGEVKALFEGSSEEVVGHYYSKYWRWCYYYTSYYGRWHHKWR